MTAVLQDQPEPIARFRPAHQPQRAGLGDDGLANSFDHDAAAWEKVTNQLLDMWRLEPGWDGEDAPPPPKPLVASALTVLTILRRGGDCPAPVRAVPTFDGTVIIEWQLPGSLAELEVVKPGVAEGTIHRRGQQTQHLLVGW